MKSSLSHLFVALPLLGLASCSSGTNASPPAAGPQELPAEDAVDPRYENLPEPRGSLPWSPPPVHTSSLPNGVRLWHLEQNGAPLVSFYVVLPRGSSIDPKGKEGLTSLTADLLDEGAGKRSALELSDELGRLATDYTSQTGVDFVLLGMNALAENFEASLEILGDIVRSPKLDRAEFERRKSHHVAQAIARSSSPASLLSEAYHKVLFGEGYGSRTAEGTKKSLEALRYEEVKKHAQLLTVPEGTELIVVGAVSEARAREAAEKVFGGWKGKRPAIEPRIEPEAQGRAAHVVPFPGAAQSSLAVLKRAGGSDDPNYFPELVMNRQLGEAFTSRINLNLREEKGYTYGAFSTFRRYRSAGFFGVVTNVRTDVTGASVQEILREIEEVCTTRPLVDAERNDAVEGLLLGYPLRFERVEEIGMQVASLAIYGRPVDFWQTWPSQVRAVSTARANEAARPHCDPKDYQVVIVGDLPVVRPQLEALGLEVRELPRAEGGAAPAAASKTSERP